MDYLFMFLMMVCAFMLIVLVLVQRGKGGGLAGAFGGMGGQSAFGTKAGDAFTRVTIFLAMFWIIICILAARFGGSSAKGLITVGGPSAATAPAVPGQGAPGTGTPAPGSGVASPAGSNVAAMGSTSMTSGSTGLSTSGTAAASSGTMAKTGNGGLAPLPPERPMMPLSGGTVSTGTSASGTVAKAMDSAKPADSSEPPAMTPVTSTSAAKSQAAPPADSTKKP